MCPPRQRILLRVPRLIFLAGSAPYRPPPPSTLLKPLPQSQCPGGLSSPSLSSPTWAGCILFNPDTIIQAKQQPARRSKVVPMLDSLRLSRLLRQCRAEGAPLTVFPGTRYGWAGTTRRKGWVVFSFGATSTGKPEGIIIAFFAAFWDRLSVRFQTPIPLIAGRLGAVRGKSANGLIDFVVIGVPSP